MPIETFEQLDVWQVAHKLVLSVYRLIMSLPSEEKYGLASQMRRAAVSVPANIAEGFKRRGHPDKARFYNIAAAGLPHYFILCRDLGYKLEYESLAHETERVGRMLTVLARTVRG